LGKVTAIRNCHSFFAIAQEAKASKTFFSVPGIFADDFYVQTYLSKHDLSHCHASQIIPLIRNSDKIVAELKAYVACLMVIPATACPWF
jgi:hypothetical protein